MKKQFISLVALLAVGLIITFAGLSAKAGWLTDFIRSGDLEDAVELITDENINEPDEEGMTPLMVAVTIGDLEITAWLIDNGADVNQPGEVEEISNTPMSIAAWEHRHDIIELLLEHQAMDPWLSNLPDFDPYELYPYVLSDDDYYDHPGWIEALLDEDETPTIVNDVNDTFIHGNCYTDVERNIITAQPGYNQDYSRYRYSQYSDGVLVEYFVVWPAYVSHSGIVYPRGVYRVEEGGPFVDIMIDEHTSRVKSARAVVGGVVTELPSIERKIYAGTIGPVGECEPILIELCKQNGDVVASYELLTEMRGAEPGVVSVKMSRWPGNASHMEH